MCGCAPPPSGGGSQSEGPAQVGHPARTGKVQSQRQPGPTLTGPPGGPPVFWLSSRKTVEHATADQSPRTCPCPAVPQRKRIRRRHSAGCPPTKPNKTAAKTLHHAINCNHAAASMSPARTPLCSQIPFTCEAEVHPMNETSTKTVKSGCHKGGFLLGEGLSLLWIWNWTQETPQRLLSSPAWWTDERCVERMAGLVDGVEMAATGLHQIAVIGR